MTAPIREPEVIERKVKNGLKLRAMKNGRVNSAIPGKNISEDRKEHRKSPISPYCNVRESSDSMIIIYKFWKSGYLKAVFPLILFLNLSESYIKRI